MGSALLVRRGGEIYKLPVLNASYPQDVTVVASASASATFSVVISEPGNPAEYTYKWYKGGNLVSGATGSTLSLTGLTAANTATVYCEVTNKAGTVTSRVATLTVQDWKPVYTYTGSAQFIDDGNYHWRIKFLTSGTLKFTSLGNASSIDVFCVGGGSANSYGGGGCGGSTKTQKSVAVSAGTNYTITIGAGAQAGNNQSLQGGGGGSTTAFGVTGGGGSSGGGTGSGGGGTGYINSKDVYFPAGNGGSDGSNGGGQHNPKTGQGTTTREFGETTGDLYSGGGGGRDGEKGNNGSGGAGGGADCGKSAAANTGGGAGGGNGQYQVFGGGSGIVVIRDHR